MSGNTKNKTSNLIKAKHIFIFGKDEFEQLLMILWGWIRGLEIQVINHGSLPRALGILKRVPFIRKYIASSVKEHKIYLGDHKGVWFELSPESTELTIEFYNQIIKRDGKIVNYYNRILNTNKFEAYIKKEILAHAWIMLKQLHIIRLLPFLVEGRVLINKNPINNFIVEYVQKKYNVKYRIKWISLNGSALSLCVYYLWLFREVLRRGIVFNKKVKSHKLAQEACSGFYDRTARDDILIDNSRFKTKDILMLFWNFETHNPVRKMFFKEAQERGFDTVSIPKLKININGNIFNILFLYIFVPLRVYFSLFFSSQLYLFNYIFLFHKRCFPMEILMNSYPIKCHISAKDWGDIEETIILNKYGAKNVLFHWSDLTSYKANGYAFIAHNIYYAWGDIHYTLHSYNYFVDERVNIGCIYKKKHNEALGNREHIIGRIKDFKKGRKTVLFCDTSFANAYEYTEKFFLNFYEIITDFCRRHNDINILLKPKNKEEDLMAGLTDNFQQYEKIRNELFSYNNFIYLEPQNYCVEELLAISDICISLAASTPSTVALICGKNGLYFDNSGNKNHPFARKYENILVFDDKDSLFKQIKDILDGKFHCSDVISESDIREYDAFADDKAIDRLRNSLYELTKDYSGHHETDNAVF